MGNYEQLSLFPDDETTVTWFPEVGDRVTVVVENVEGDTAKFYAGIYEGQLGVITNVVVGGSGEQYFEVVFDGNGRGLFYGHELQGVM